MAVSYTIDSTERICTHNHWFENIFCDKVSLIKKIIVIAFHIITLCIPLALYHIIACCCPSKAKYTFEAPPRRESLFSIASREEISDEDAQYVTSTCAFAEQLLKDNQSLDEWKWLGVINIYPINDCIAPMTQLFWTTCFEKFKQALQKYPENTWQNEEVLEAASDLLRVGFAIADLTFKDMNALSKVGDYNKPLDQPKPYLDIMSSHSRYAAYTIYYCANVYSWIKGEVIWKDNHFAFPRQDEIASKLELMDKNSYVAVSNLGLTENKRFYESGTIQNKFRVLYNEYCSKLLACIKSDFRFNFESLEITALPEKDKTIGSFKVRAKLVYDTIYKFCKLIQF